MNDIIFEIAKQLTFESSFKLKLLIKLLNKRLYGYIKLHIFPYNHTLLNDERIDLFPDLKELNYGTIKSFNESKLEKLKLVSLKLTCIINKFSYISNMISLKKLDIYVYLSYFNTNPFEKLNLKYLKYFGENVHIPNEYISHMDLEFYEDIIDNHGYPDRILFFKNTIKHIEMIIDNNAQNNFNNLLKCNNIYSLELLIDNYEYINENLFDFNKLSTLHIHKLTLVIQDDINDNATNIIINILLNTKLYELHIIYLYNGNLTIPIEILIKNKLTKLYTTDINKISNDDLKIINDNGIEVIQY